MAFNQLRQEERGFRNVIKYTNIMFFSVFRDEFFISSSSSAIWPAAPYQVRNASKFNTHIGLAKTGVVQ